METFQKEENAEEKNNAGSATLMWREFVGNTTLHGLRYVFLKRPKWIRALWLLLILTAAGYYSVIVVNAVKKFLQRPMNTVINTKYAEEIDFPAVTICPLNSLSLRKISILDNDESFVKEGLNMTECAATAAVRAGEPCGLAFLCCCVRVEIFEVSTLFPECTKQYRQQLISALKEKNVVPNIHEFFRLYGTHIHDILTPWPTCFFGLDGEACNLNDFDAAVKDYGAMCFTFNSGSKKPVKKATQHGAVSGLSVLLDARVSDYSLGKYSQGFKIIVHNQGEYVDSWSGISVAPGSHAVVVTSREQVVNLPAPYATNCKEMTLKQFPRYTREGCMYECEAANNVDKCGCRPLEYQVPHEDARFCGSLDKECVENEGAVSDYNSCGCEVPCSLIKYKTTASYSKFPDAAVNRFIDASGYNWTEEYRRTNLVFLQVGYTSLSYQIQEQKAAYDSGALFGEIGGNMGLFLGCSLLTICEFVDFFASVFISRGRRRVLAV